MRKLCDGTRTSRSNRAKFPAASRMSAPITVFESFVLWLKSTKNDDFFALIGPLRFAPNVRVWLGARFAAKGLRELNRASLKLKFVEPRNLSKPGFVRISIRPNPTRSYSAETGFWLMRISRIASVGGI